MKQIVLLSALMVHVKYSGRCEVTELVLLWYLFCMAPTVHVPYMY